MEETTVTSADFPDGLTLPEGLVIQVSETELSKHPGYLWHLNIEIKPSLVMDTNVYLTSSLAPERLTVQVEKSLDTSNETKVNQ